MYVCMQHDVYESGWSSPLQGEWSSQEVQPVAVKYTDHLLLMRFNYMDPQLTLIRNSTCGTVCVNLITQMNPIKSEAEQMDRVGATSGSFKNC